MPNQKKRRKLKTIVALLENREFINDSHDYWDHHRRQSSIIGEDKEEWDRQAEMFMAQFLDPFIEKWGVYPPPVKLLSSPLWQMKRDATMTGRWGVIPVYPWTTEKEVKQQARQIQRAIGKKHQDFTAYRQALKAKWLEDSHISEAANRPPGRNKIAAEVWGRKEGLKRPSKEVGIANLSIRREADLMKHYMARGKTRQEATQLIYRRARGSESLASAMVRMALRRLQNRERHTKTIMTDPQKTDTLGLAVTMLLLELPTSKSSPRNLEAICAKAVDLGNLLLPPESPA